MAGTATLGANLLDRLTPTVDRLRGTLNGQFGTRAFRCFTVLRTWNGEIEGDGPYEDVVAEIAPAPRVRDWSDRYHWVMTPMGTHEDGLIEVSEISLTYTYDELNPTVIDKNQQFFYVLREAHGNGSAPRVLRMSRPPFPDREKTIGWVVKLMDMNIPEDSFPELPA